MRVFLDARDLIALLQNSHPCDPETFGHRLAGGGHELVLTPTVVFELAAPIASSSAPTVVTPLLDALESLPVVYLGSAQIPPGELEEAIRAFTEGREYSYVGPFQARFDASIPAAGPATTHLYLHHSLAETVFTIAQEAPDVLRRSRLPLPVLRDVLKHDRALTGPPLLSRRFREKIRCDLESDRVDTASVSVADLADWIYESPARCPALRLRYEVYHQLRANFGDNFRLSDFGDFAHILSLPYVDVATLDRRMATYVKQASQDWERGLRPVVVFDTLALLDKLT